MKHNFKLFCLFLSVVLLCAFLMGGNSAVFADATTLQFDNSQLGVATKTSAFADKKHADSLFSSLTSTNYVLYDIDSGSILTSFNEHEKRQVASICKLMTTLIVLENVEKGKLSLGDEFTTSVYASEAEGSQAFLDAGSKYSVKELLKSVIVASANDSAIVLAEGISGNEKLFVGLMNKRANELGMVNTFYENSTGLETAGQHSSAYDTAILLKEVGKHGIFNEDCKIWMDKLVHPSGRETELVNTNRLIRYYDKCKSGKTGFTDSAGYCLGSVASDGKLNLIAVTLNCKNSALRFKENMELYAFGFANFENQKVLDESAPLSKLPVNFGKQASVEVGVDKDYYVLLNKSEDAEITTHFELHKKVSAPVKIGDKVGVCIILKNGVVIEEVDVISKSNVGRQNFRDVIRKIAGNWEF